MISTLYTNWSGTSLAAPAAAAGAALIREYCESQGNTIGALGLRAVLMASAQRNALDSRYSTPYGTTPEGPSDWKDGAGVLSLNAAEAVCDPRQQDVWAGYKEEPIDLSTGDPMPDDPGYVPPGVPPESSTSSGLSPQDQVLPTTGTDRPMSRVLLDLGALNRSARVRVVVLERLQPVAGS